MKHPIVSNPPSKLEDLVRWLLDFQNAIYSAFSTVNYHDVITDIPIKPKIGMVVYFGLGTPAPITHEGLWVYTSVGWKPCNA